MNRRKQRGVRRSHAETQPPLFGEPSPDVDFDSYDQVDALGDLQRDVNRMRLETQLERVRAAPEPVVIPSHSVGVPTREQLLAAELPFEVRSPARLVGRRIHPPVIRRYASAEHAATHLVVETLVLQDRRR